MEPVIRALDSLIELLSKVKGLPPEDALGGAAQELITVCNSIGNLSAAVRSSIGSKVRRLGGLLAEFDEKAQRAMAARGATAAVTHAVEAAAEALHGLANLANLAGCSKEDCAGLAAAAAVLLGSGQQAHAVLARRGDPAWEERLMLATYLLLAARSTLQLLKDPRHGGALLPDVAAIFKPAPTLAWLGAMTGTVCRACELAKSGGLSEAPFFFTAPHAGVCQMLLACPSLPELLTAGCRDADISFKRQLAQLLTQHTLPAVVAAMVPVEAAARARRLSRDASNRSTEGDWRALHDAVIVLAVVCAPGALDDILGQQRQRQALRRLALQLAAQLPALPVKDEVHPLTHKQAWVAAGQLLCWSRQPWRPVRELSPAQQAAQQAQLEAAGWEVLPVMANLGEALTWLLSVPDLGYTPSNFMLPITKIVQMWNDCWAPVFDVPPKPPASATTELVAQGLVAAAAGLRLLPSLLALADREGETYSGAWTNSALGAAERCMALWEKATFICDEYIEPHVWHGCASAGPSNDPILTAELNTILMPAAFRLHSTSCRLTHWASTVATPQQMATLEKFGGVWDAAIHDTLYFVFRDAFALMYVAAICAQGEARDALMRQIRGACAAQWEAMQVIASALSCPVHERPDKRFIDRWTHQLGWIADMAPAGWHSTELVQQMMLCTMASARRQDVPLESVLQAVDSMAHAASHGPGAAVAVAGSGLLADMLGLPSLLARRPGQVLHWQVTQYCSHLHYVFKRLQQTASYYALSACPEDDSAESRLLRQELLSAAMSLHVGVPAEMPRLNPQDVLESATAFLERLRQACLPGAVAVAEALQSLWQRPAFQEEPQMAMATAVATTRSCAYLRCANLGSAGGPAAGQGAGSQKCSACRAAWYCGTACSHADWRAGGHKRRCKALAAARQQQAAPAAAGSG